ncbi:hypothetical protein K438DRAFT_281761 [Mycena galopus ATCC 62051]|nr:hypothetical protein K438DRAFT_281761 [Mycena galopus ATCC 62051]
MARSLFQCRLIPLPAAVSCSGTDCGAHCSQPLHAPVSPATAETQTSWCLKLLAAGLCSAYSQYQISLISRFCVHLSEFVDHRSNSGDMFPGYVFETMRRDESATQWGDGHEDRVMPRWQGAEAECECELGADVLLAIQSQPLKNIQQQLCFLPFYFPSKHPDGIIAAPTRTRQCNAIWR